MYCVCTKKCWSEGILNAWGSTFLPVPIRGHTPRPQMQWGTDKVWDRRTLQLYIVQLYLSLSNQKHLLLFHKDGYWHTLAEGLSNPKQGCTPGHLIHMLSSPHSTTGQSIISFFSNSHWHTCVWAVISHCIHQPSGFLLFVKKVQSNLWWNQIIYPGISLCPPESRERQALPPLYPPLFTPTIRTVQFKTLKVNRKT